MLPVLAMDFTWQLTEIIMRQSSAKEYVLRSGLCSTDQLSVRELIDDADDSLFSQLMNNENRVLHQLLPACHHSDDLQPRNHPRLLTQKPDNTVESDFIIRMLFTDPY